MSTEMRKSLSFEVGCSFCIDNIRYSTYLAWWHCVLHQKFFRILEKFSIFEEFLAENLSLPSTFQEFASYM